MSTFINFNRFGQVFSSLQAEIMAIKYGLGLARNNSLLFVVIESDSLLAINEISKQESLLCE